RRGELTIAVGYLEEAIRLTAEYGTARYVLGQALRKLGRTEAAMQQLELAEQQRNEEPRVPDPLRQRLDALRTGAIDALHRGIDLLQQGQVEHAIALLEEAVRINPDLPEAHGQLGTALLKRGQLEHAEASLRRALNLDPNFVDALYNLGLIAHRRNNYSEAARHFALAVSIRPQHFDAHLGLGADLSRLGRTDEAIEHLRAAARLRPDDPRPYKRLGSALAALGRYEEAIRWLRDGVQRLPNDASIADRLAWILATCPQEQWRVSAEALRIAEAVCRRTNNAVPQALDTLAAALANLGRFEEAIAAAEQALQMARANDNRDLASEIEARLDRYRAGRPYRQPSP
ncbi:MAG: tetratricopeptide repeat protein, partial [Planctomycetota bacterium]|nr:tetratricopeptide repeat protein [Planctomycetota bacterium]